MRQLVKAPDRKLLGVAGGIADYFAMDRTIVRAITVLGCIVFPPLVLGYFVLGIVQQHIPGAQGDKALRS
jgi:phage shock protein C